MMEELKPCPFCGEVEEIKCYSYYGIAFVLCLSCEAEGPPRDEEHEAIESWNKRA